MSKSKKIKAPNCIIPMKNPDKKMHESYNKNCNTNMARFPKPFKCVISGRPNSGKTLMSKMIIVAHQAQKPKFDEIHIVHGLDENFTSEWDDVEPTSFMNDIPSYEDFDPTLRTLVIFDDVDYTKISREDLKRLSEIVRFGSSHCNISCIFMTQVFFRIPKIIKDCAQIFIIYKTTDLDGLATIGRRVGLTKEKINSIFDTFTSFRDSLTVNLIPNAPRMYSYNLFEPLPDHFDLD